MIDQLKKWLGITKKQAKPQKVQGHLEQTIILDLKQATEEFDAQTKGPREGSVTVKYYPPDENLDEWLEFRISLTSEFGTRINTHKGKITEVKTIFNEGENDAGKDNKYLTRRK